ncbi:DUF1120 domain-containing protein [Escherichia albertii]|uniref:DUF1120 domain-containing protein n=1 Tax=Escherichia albertii TaxID=208962 RepID=UPI000BFA073A|nr:DUF1120 domain-containing protein [Escherichia albertii]PFF96448.1 hypothetical protein CRH02_09725 [Escherichia albertii]WDC35019.1 DUF1120 domain-containing protein [Escherichia albertii]
MKIPKSLIAGLLFCGLLIPVQAANRVTINAKVSLEAAACTPKLSNSGVVNFGSHSINKLSTTHYTQIGVRDINLTITCESAAGVAITARDTRVSSVTIGQDDESKNGVKYTVTGGGHISEPTRLFGLGTTQSGESIGSYAVLINADAITASNGDETLNVTIAGADAVISGQRRSWQTLPAYPLASDQNYYYTFVKAGESTPTPITYAIVPLQVTAAVANGLGSSDKIELDGKAVISIVYL